MIVLPVLEVEASGASSSSDIKFAFTSKRLCATRVLHSMLCNGCNPVQGGVWLHLFWFKWYCEVILDIFLFQDDLMCSIGALCFHLPCWQNDSDPCYESRSLTSTFY